MTEDQIKHMAERFLCWKLPDPWHPDGGISFEPVGNMGMPEYEYRREPTGTNLFDYTQAVEMVRHMVAGGMPTSQWLPIDSAPKDRTTILAACRGEPQAVLVYWDDNFGWLDDRDDNGWIDGFGPTHWMPLPSPPATQHKDAGK